MSATKTRYPWTNVGFSAAGGGTDVLARAFARQLGEAIGQPLPITVLRNEYNQGYGGNQKVGYAYAIRERFDVVCMLHGDGQYAPEELPNLVAPLRDVADDC